MCRLLLILLFGLLAGCHKLETPLPPVQQSRELVVVTHNGPMTYYVNGQDQFVGIEYELAKLFAEDLSRTLGEEVRLKVVVVENITQVIPALLKNKAHLAAASLSVTHLREHLVRFGPSYQTVQQQLVYNEEKGRQPKALDDLAGGSLVIPKSTSYAERLQEVARSQPQLHWREEDKVNSEELLERVAEGSLDYTIADSPLVAMTRNYYPNLGTAFDFGRPDKLAWAFPKNGDDWLYQQAHKFFNRIEHDGTLRTLLERYYGHTKRLKQVDVTGFLIKSRTVLPQYIGLFKQAQELTGLDWRLLAAIGYQESHWDRYATSPTNVRGLMMLTEDTADRLGVTDRLDPRQSILAGARYVLNMKETIPDQVPEPDRTWMALAAYNIGYAHLEDARTLAKRMKLNPDSWADVKRTLPLLGREEYFSTLKYGFARGGAPVVFVESIRTYHTILEKHEGQHKPLLPSFKLAAREKMTAFP